MGNSVLIWPNGDYWLSEDGEPPSYKSDDYLEFSIDDIDFDEFEDVDEWVEVKLQEVDLGTSTNKRTLFK